MVKFNNFKIFMILLSIMFSVLFFFILFYNEISWPEGRFQLVASTITTSAIIIVMLYQQILSEQYQERALKNQIRREYLLRNVEIYAAIRNELPIVKERIKYFGATPIFSSFEQIKDKTDWNLIDENYRLWYTSFKDNLDKYNNLYEGFSRNKLKELLKQQLENFETKENWTTKWDRIHEKVLSDLLLPNKNNLKEDLRYIFHDQQEAVIDVFGKNYSLERTVLEDKLLKILDILKKDEQYNQTIQLQIELLTRLEQLEPKLLKSIREPWVV